LRIPRRVFLYELPHRRLRRERQVWRRGRSQYFGDQGRHWATALRTAISALKAV